jgi:hypothetical protein
MDYLGSKDEAYTLLEIRLQASITNQLLLARVEENKGNSDIKEIYTDIARFCLEQLEKVQEMKKHDNYKIYYPHAAAIYGNEG